MFRQPIFSTPLTTDIADSYFDNRIAGETWQGDSSFVATLRALLDARMGEQDTLYVEFKSTSYTAAQLTSVPSDTIATVLMSGNDGQSNRIVVHVLNSSIAADNKAWLEWADRNLVSRRNGWSKVERVTVFFRKKFDVLCFINPERKSTLLVVNNMDMKSLHYLQAGTPAFLPWYFPPDGGITDEEMGLLESLRETKSENYESRIARISEKYNFEEMRIRKLLNGFETRYERLKIEQVRRDIEDKDQSIIDHNSAIGNLLQQRRDLENRLLGLETKIQQSSGENSEIMEYFLCNNHLKLISVSQTTMRFVAMGELTYYDEDMARSTINNRDSFVYHPGNDYRPARMIEPDDMKMLMEAIFLDQKLRIRFCAAYEFQLEGNVRGIEHFGYGHDFEEYMPNTHIDSHRCLGNYSRSINECLSRHNYIGALEQCIASCKSLNFADSIVMRGFMKTLYGYADMPNNRCIVLPDGSVVKPDAAIAYLKAEAEKGEENG